MNVYQVCPHCKRLLHGNVAENNKTMFCNEHGEVTPINSAVVNYQHEHEGVDWSAA